MDKKKLSAAMAAVFAYIKTSEEAASFYGPQVSGPTPDLFAQHVQVMQQTNIWGISGRGTHMQANSMMQMRMFK
ncbi:MAG: hypothetical protein KKE12_07910 [Proteobacteria bacterium]|nr:hypothetical protein [Pseudomonadota bacterium]